MGSARRTMGALALLLVLGLAPLAAAGEEAPTLDTPAGWLSKAEGIVERVEVPAARAALLVSVGTGWVEAGDFGRARPLLAEAAAFGAKCDACLTKARRLAEIALLQHQAGDEMGSGATFETARKACEELDGVFLVGALSTLAQLRQEAGEAMIARMLFAEATKAAKALEGLDWAEATASIADAQAAAGNLDAAEAVRGRLFLRGNRLGQDLAPILASTFMTGAAAEMKAGRLEHAASILEEISFWPIAASGYASLARARYEAGVPGVSPNLRRALEIADKLKDPIDRVDAYAEIARVAQATRIQVAEARARGGVGDSAREIEDPATRVRAFVVWADVQREAGAPMEAAKALEEAGRLAEGKTLEAETRDSLRAAVASADARAGRFPEAERLTAAIEDAVRKVRARLDLAEAYHRAGNDAQALAVCTEQLAAMATWPEDLAADRAESMRQAARLQAACGRLEDAAKTVDAIDRPFHAATACTYIASDLTGE